MFYFKFEYPYIFLIILLFIVCDKFCKSKTPSIYMPHINLYSKSDISFAFINILKWVSIILLLTALASPIKERNSIDIKNDGIDIVISLDTSGSMKHIGFNKENLHQNRWEGTKEIVQEFIPKRLNDNIALVVFGSSVMVASPLSYDKEAINHIIDNLGIGIIGEKTALVDSVASSINILKNSEAKSKVLILLTDGEDTASEIPFSIVEKLIKKHKIKVYTISIGSRGSYILNQLSNISGGKSYAVISKNQLKEVYKDIDALEKSEIQSDKIILKDYYFFYPLFFGIIFLLLYLLIKNKRGF